MNTDNTDQESDRKNTGEGGWATRIYRSEHSNGRLCHTGYREPGDSAFQIVPKRVHYFRAQIVGLAGGGLFHVSHQAFKVVA
jgi:hypothetical protein